MLFAPLDGWRRVEVSVARVDWAHVIKKLVRGSTLTETGSCWYGQSQHSQAVLANEAFEPAEARDS